MEIDIKTLIDFVKSMPESKLETAIEKLEEIKREGEKEKSAASPVCPKCEDSHVVRNGRQSGKQQYLCKTCGRSFVETANSAASHSHASKTVWKTVIADTINGVSIDTTAGSLDLHHKTVFNMYRKILNCLEKAALGNQKPLGGVFEADETYIFESVKGKKIPDDCHRKMCRHGAAASKRGISDEYICICAATERGGAAFGTAVNRVAASKQEILEVFGNRVNAGALLLCDGAKNYEILSESGKCATSHAKQGLNSINAVNCLHKLIKE
ncbi:MAG: IS1595 family transposase [Clostridiales bacterium]|jgi:transposase-like protein|nr:IS1595 family transposase [Clostridiales bacterium]